VLNFLLLVGLTEDLIGVSFFFFAAFCRAIWGMKVVHTPSPWAIVAKR
jgi:hypothetical protein